MGVSDSALGVRSLVLFVGLGLAAPPAASAQTPAPTSPQAETAYPDLLDGTLSGTGDQEDVDALRRGFMRFPTLLAPWFALKQEWRKVPSCTLMFKQEIPLMYPDDADVAAVRDAMFDPFEYFVQRRKDGLLKTQFVNALGKISYHIPCHSRVQNMGQKTREMLEAIPGSEVTTVERCSGHDGTWGVKTEYFDNSMKIGRPVFRRMAEPGPDYVSSDCPIAARHILQGMAESGASAEKAHPLTLLRKAYGL
jgi:hypothetical protein